MSALPLHRYIYFYQSENALAFAASTSGTALVIDRTTAGISLELLNTTLFPPPQTIYGIIGTIRLRLDTYVILITGRESVGHLTSHEIWRLTKFEIVPLRFGKGSALQDADEAGFVHLISHHFNNNPFYFSYTYNLTNSLQQNAKQPTSPTTPFWQRSDDRFYWNRYLQSSLIAFRNQSPSRAEIDPFILPVIFGFLHIQHTFANHKALTIALISRRSRLRVGTRFFSRGIDAQGNVSNFNETEQMLLVPGTTGQKWMSYVQTRGSIPVYWAEVMDLKYKPKLRIFGPVDKSVEPARKHFEEQVGIYGGNILVNLVNQKGHEKPIKLAFEELMRNMVMDKVKYVYFDFHAECRKMRWDRISLLLDHLQDDLIKQQYTLVEGDTLVKEQTSVIRTNCMDCLDRTNVVQSTFARHVITKQLIDCGIFKETDRVDMFPDFERMFRNIWADNANVVSKAYSGTGALKTDFTRTGKRSTSGLLVDGQNSVERYILNNFFDVTRQDAFDLVLGNYEPWDMLSQSQIFVDHRALFIQAVPYILYASIIMIISAYVLPRADSILPPILADKDAKLPLNAFLAFWIVALIWSIYFIFTNGKLYVRWPRLVPLDFAPDISGVKRDGIASLEKGEGRGHKRDISVSAPKGPVGVLGTLFGRWAPGHGGGEDMELVIAGKEGRAHAE